VSLHASTYAGYNFQQCSVSYVQDMAEIRGICPHFSPKEVIGIQNRELTLKFCLKLRNSAGRTRTKNSEAKKL